MRTSKYNAIPLASARAYLRQNTTAGLVTHRALADTRVRSGKQQDRCTRAAGHLYASGWMHALGTPMCGFVSETELARMQAKVAYKQLQVVGLAPTFWIASWVVRQFLLPFLVNLILRHMAETWLD